MTNATPAVRKIAARYGVDLDKVRGGGVGGRIRPADVLAAAGVPASSPARAPLAAAAPASSSWSNPVHARALAVRAGLPAGLRGSGPEPTLFESGDLPPFTASGIDPRTLLSVPTAARHPMARAATPAAAYAIAQAYSGPGADVAAAVELANDPGNQDYLARMARWAGTALGEDVWLSDEAAASAGMPRGGY